MIHHDFAIGYRNENLGATLRLEGLLEARGDEARSLAERVGGLHAARVARSAMGATMIAGFGLMIAESLRTMATSDHIDHALPIFLGSWLAGGLAYALAHTFTRARFADSLVPMPELGHGPRADVELLEASAPAREARAQVERWERRSLALPMVALSLFAPLTLHWLVTLLVGALATSRNPALDPSAFGAWIGLSLLVVGHCHLVLVFLVLRRVKTLTSRTGVPLAFQEHEGFRAFGWTALSTLPVAVLFLIPTALVGVTGIVFIPAMFARARSTLLAERAQLDTL